MNVETSTIIRRFPLFIIGSVGLALFCLVSYAITWFSFAMGGMRHSGGGISLADGEFWEALGPSVLASIFIAGFLARRFRPVTLALLCTAVAGVAIWFLYEAFNARAGVGLVSGAIAIIAVFVWWWLVNNSPRYIEIASN